MNNTPLLKIENWSVQFYSDNSTNKRFFANNKVNIEIYPNQIVGLMGHSRCGKSVLARSIIGIPQGAIDQTGKIFFKGKRIDCVSSREKCALRHRELMLINQENLSALDPLWTPIMVMKSQWKKVNRNKIIRDAFQYKGQLLKTLSRIDKKASSDTEKWIKKVELLNMLPKESQDGDPLRNPVGIYSGGMIQTLLLAQILISDPEMIICDETTTGMDVTLQKRIFDLLQEFVKERSSIDNHKALLLITHDFDLIAEYCDYIYVMGKGEITNHGRKDEMLQACDKGITVRPSLHRKLEFKDEALKIFVRGKDNEPANDKSISPLYNGRINDMNNPILKIKNLNISDINGQHHILRNISFEAYAGEWIGLVGESGSGKTSLLKVIKGIHQNLRIIDGEIEISGESASYGRKKLNRSVQLIPQNVNTSFNPWFDALETITEYWPLSIKAGKGNLMKSELGFLLGELGIEFGELHQLPSTRVFSGGRRQLLAWARAFWSLNKMAEADNGYSRCLLLLDEPFSNLDSVIQRVIINYLIKLKGKLALILVSHNLHRVMELCERILVIKKGEIIERTNNIEILNTRVEHDEYTNSLISALPNVC